MVVICAPAVESTEDVASGRLKLDGATVHVTLQSQWNFKTCTHDSVFEIYHFGFITETNMMASCTTCVAHLSSVGRSGRSVCSPSTDIIAYQIGLAMTTLACV